MNIFHSIILDKIYWYKWRNIQKIICTDIRNRNIDVFIDYIYLTQLERDNLLTQQHEYLFDQLF